MTLDSDRLLQTKIQHREVAFPRLNGESGKLIGEGCCIVSSVLGCCILNFFADFSHPARVGGEIAEEPAGVDAAVYDAGEKSADDELVAVRNLLTESNTSGIIDVGSTYSNHLPQVITLVQQVLQRIILSLSSLLPLIHDALQNEVQSRTSDSLVDEGWRESFHDPWQYDD